MPVFFAVYSVETGLIASVGSTEDADLAAEMAGPGQAVIITDQPINPLEAVIVEGLAITTPPRPEAAVGWSGTAWITDSEAEQAILWRLLRSERDRRLSVSDWAMLPDAPTNSDAWAAYRAALRDLPETTLDPAAPVWPLPPQH